ncbi:MAG: PhoH family protein [Desulfurococcaceae archaeon]|nr:PhoH family protein [Desulfurococcaceae archaeon]
MEELFDKIEPKSPGQEELKKALLSDKDLVGVFGPTGTGKSLFAIAYGLTAVYRGKYRRLVLSRPIIDVVSGREITLFSEPETYFKHASEYLRDILAGFADVKALEDAISSGKLILADPHFLRGRTFDDSVIVLDDAQSVPAETIVEIVTRMGRNSRLIIAGDPIFQRTAELGRDGATLAREILFGEETAVVVDLGVKDIVRPGARRGVKLLLELQMRKRVLDEVEKKVKDTAKVYAADADIITVANLTEAKKRWEITSEHAPDVLIVVKEGHLGRIIGVGGERIQSIEKEVGLKLRAIQLTLDLKEFIRAVHPVAWIHKHIVDFDFAGNSLKLTVARGHMGPMLGQKGSYIRFLNDVMEKLIGVEVNVVESEEEVEKARRRRR